MRTDADLDGPSGYDAAPNGTTEEGAQVEERVPVVLNEHEAARARAVATYLAARADNDPVVQEARRFVTGAADDTVTPEQASALLASPAARCLTKRVFIRHGIPLIGHRAELLDAHPDAHLTWRGGRVTVRFTWPLDEQVEVDWRPDGARPRGDSQRASVEVPDAAGGGRKLATRRHSILDRLGRWSRDLARRYPWRPDQSLWFLLTREPPQVVPLVVTVVHHHDETPPRIKIDAEPWVSTETVLRSYREVQHRLLGGRSRPTGERLVALLEFVATHRLRKEPATWRALLPLWNADHPEWAFDDVRNLATEAKRAEQLLLPPYGARASQGSRPDPQEGDTL